MPKTESTNPYRDLEVRTTEFAKMVIRLCKKLPSTTINRPLIDQIIRSSGSVGANYREANEAVGKKDFTYRIRIARKETKETDHWLQLIEVANPTIHGEIVPIAKEASELRSIFTSIHDKSL